MREYTRHIQKVSFDLKNKKDLKMSYHNILNQILFSFKKTKYLLEGLKLSNIKYKIQYHKLVKVNNQNFS
jgi:hypothetical protein